MGILSYPSTPFRFSLTLQVYPIRIMTKNTNCDSQQVAPSVSESCLGCFLHLATAIALVVACAYLFLSNSPQVRGLCGGDCVGCQLQIPEDETFCKLAGRECKTCHPYEFSQAGVSSAHGTEPFENMQKLAALNPSKWCHYEEIRRKCPEQCPAWMLDYISESEL